MADQESTASHHPVDFLALKNIVMLAAFATEARRVLTEIDQAASMLPDLDGRLGQLVSARRQWAVYDDTVPEVLDGVAKQLSALAGEEA